MAPSNKATGLKLVGDPLYVVTLGEAGPAVQPVKLFGAMIRCGGRNQRGQKLSTGNYKTNKHHCGNVDPKRASKELVTATMAIAAIAIDVKVKGGQMRIYFADACGKVSSLWS